MVRSLSRVACLLAFGTAFFLVGCQKDSLTGPAETSQAQGPFVRLLELPKGSLHKVSTTSETITVQSGGKLQIHYAEDDPVGGKDALKIDVEVRFAPGSVSDDFVASMTADANYAMTSLNLSFGPQNVTFLKPAEVKMHVTGMNLSRLPAGAELRLYLVEDGTWVPMPGTVTFNARTGEVKCLDGQLPHFSRYAFGY